MKAILKEKLTIDRPIVFLCGPYYDGKNDHDRRALVRSYIRICLMLRRKMDGFDKTPHGKNLHSRIKDIPGVIVQ